MHKNDSIQYIRCRNKSDKHKKTLEDRKEDCIILTRNDKPTIKMTLIEENSRKDFFGCAKGLFEVPNDFDEIDISKDFTSEIFPK